MSNSIIRIELSMSDRLLWVWTDDETIFPKLIGIKGVMDIIQNANRYTLLLAEGYSAIAIQKIIENF